MRILFIANCGSLYGANRSMLELARGLKKLSQEVYFFFPCEIISKERHLLKANLNEYGFTYVFLKYESSIHFEKEKKIEDILLRDAVNRKCLVKMREYVKKWEIDIIHTNSLTHQIGAALSRQVRKPHVWHIREALREHYGVSYDSKLLYKYALRNTEQVICISDYVREIYKDILRPYNVITLKNGIDINKYILNDVYKTYRDMYSLIICGLIQEEKGQLDAVKAINYLIRDYEICNIHLQIVGDGSRTYCEEIKEYIMHNNLQNYIDIIPFQEDLRELRKNADIALMCSRSEALGRVTIESMLSENLVIGADTAGTKEIIRDGENGYLYKSGNAKALSEKIYDVINHWDKQEKVIRNAKEYAIKNYDINYYAKKILAIYRKVILE